MWALQTLAPGFVTKRNFFCITIAFFMEILGLWTVWQLQQSLQHADAGATVSGVFSTKWRTCLGVKTIHLSSQNWAVKMFDDGMLMLGPCSCHNCHLTRGCNHNQTAIIIFHLRQGPVPPLPPPPTIRYLLMSSSQSPHYCHQVWSRARVWGHQESSTLTRSGENITFSFRGSLNRSGLQTQNGSTQPEQVKQ